MTATKKFSQTAIAVILVTLLFQPIKIKAENELSVITPVSGSTIITKPYMDFFSALKKSNIKEVTKERLSTQKKGNEKEIAVIKEDIKSISDFIKATSDLVFHVFITLLKKLTQVLS